MGDAKGKTKYDPSSPNMWDQGEGHAYLGKHYFCGGDVYFISVPEPDGVDTDYRTCLKCAKNNLRGGVLHLAREARLWK
jgi:hypothetical protein